VETKRPVEQEEDEMYTNEMGLHRTWSTFLECVYRVLGWTHY
jgi:hypothetical protein